MFLSHVILHKRAFSLIETAIVLGVVGLVIGGIWVAAASVMQQQKIGDTLAAISTIQANLSRLYTNNRPASDFQISGALLQQIKPASLQLDTAYPDAVIDPLGGNFRISIAPEHIVILFGVYDNALFEKYCQILAPRLGSSFRQMAPAQYNPIYVHPHPGASNVMGGANDSDLGTPDLAAANCGIEDGIILYLSY